MRVIGTIMVWYIGVGAILGIVLGKQAMKYRDRVEENLGEEITITGVRLLMIVTMLTWPKKVITFIRIIVLEITDCIKKEG